MFVEHKPFQRNDDTVNLCSIRERAGAILRDDRDGGSSLIEFALTLPPLFLIVTGIWVFGFAMNNYLILTNATTVAARQISISRGQSLDPCATAVSALTAAAPTLTASKFTYSYAFNSVAYSGTTCVSTSYATGAPSNLVQGQPAQITVNYPCSLLAYNANFAPTCNLKAQITELVQ
jgi:Flp pilus assembly protein TadG